MLENNMIIEGIVSRLLNEKNIRLESFYHVSVDANDVIVLTEVSKSEDDTWVPNHSSTKITIDSDCTTWTLLSHKFITFVNVTYTPNKERQPVDKYKKERLSALFEGISKEDIITYLKQGV